MINLIVTMTNKKIQKSLNVLTDDIRNSDKNTHFKLVDNIEIYAFLGLTYFCFLFGQNKHSVDTLFSDHVFGASLSWLTSPSMMKVPVLIIGSMTGLQLTESSLKHSMTIVQNILCQQSIFPWMKHCIQ